MKFNVLEIYFRLLNQIVIYMLDMKYIVFFLSISHILKVTFTICQIVVVFCKIII